MAAPFKRICMRASYRHPLYCTLSTSSPLAAESNDLTPSNADLDVLSSQPGVKYSVTEEKDDLRHVSANMSNMSSLAHREMEQHKELREITRLAAWEMPLLSQFAKPYIPPREDQVLRWRYTTYLGEPHPAARKVVVTFQPERLKEMNGDQLAKFLKLCGPRYNPERGEVKMSCESFETQAQNKRYLADTINKLITESKDSDADNFADIPLDTRHHKPKIRHKFPQSWALTPERRKQLDNSRRAKMLEEGKKVEEDKMIDGMKVIEAAEKLDLEKEEAPLMANVRQPLARGKQGKKEMGQQKVNRP